MGLYKYKAKDAKGRTIGGRMQAASEQELHTLLKENGKFLISASEVNLMKQNKPLKAKQLADFCRQMGTLVGSGVSLVRALRIISEEETLTPKEKEIYEDLLVLVRQGKPISESMEAANGAFPALMINMFKAAELSGNFDKTANRMADMYDKQDKLDHKIKSSMTYPKILVVMMIVVVIIIMAYVIPQFSDMFAAMDSLPVATTILLGLSDFIVNNILLLVVLAVILVLGVNLLMKVPSIKLKKDKLLLRMPKVGKLQQIIFTARFARTLSSMYASGIPIVTSLQIARKTIGNTYIDSQFDEVIAQVRRGNPLSDALGEVDGFTNKLVSSIRVGEETGRLDYMLSTTADSMDYESEMAIQQMVSYLEPVMIVVLAVVVGFIMIAVIQPIYGSYATIGQSSY